MHVVVKRIREFSFFVVRSAEGMMQIFVHIPDGSDVGMVRSIVKALSKGDGFAITSMELDSIYRGRVRKPLFFASHLCVLQI